MKKILLLAASLLTGMAVYAYQPTANPTEPTGPANQVKAVYSDTYGADCDFVDGGSGTTYTQEEYGKKFVTTSNGYFSLAFTGMNCSKMEYLHLDLFADGTENYTINVVPICTGQPEGGVTLSLEPTSNTWSRIDIPLTGFTDVSDWTNVSQIKINNAAERTFWLNNVYFYTEQEPTSVEVTIPECGFATLCSDHQLKIPDDVRVFYYNTYDDNTRTLFSEQVPDGEVLQKETGYVVKATPGTYEFEFADAATAYKVENNLLRGAAGNDLPLEYNEELMDQKIYVLGTIDGKTAFYRYTGYVIPAGKAFYVMDGVKSNTERLDDISAIWIWTRE